MKQFVLAATVALASGTVVGAERGGPGDPVMLEAIGVGPGPGALCASKGFQPLEFQRLLPNGLASPFPDTPIPPQNKRLVVTDVDWQQNGGTPGTTHLLRLFLVNRGGDTPGNRVHEVPMQLDATGAGAVATSATTGFMMSSAAALCLDVLPIGSGEPGILQHVLLRGYYVEP